MGNAQSGPADSGGEAARRPKKLVKPPDDWNDGNEFVMISPLSDLSNPSQFRHRVKDPNNPQQQQRQLSSRPLTKGRHAVRQTQRRPNTVPPPKGFYFDKPEAKQATTEVSPRRVSGQKWVVSRQKAMKRTAKGAKKLLQGCVNDKRAALCTREKPVDHQRLPSFSTAQVQKVTAVKSNEVPAETLKEEGLQFVVPVQPTVTFNPLLEVQSSPSDDDDEDSKVEIIKPYIHDEMIYVDRIADSSKHAMETPLEAKNSNSSTESMNDNNENVERVVIHMSEIQPHTPMEERAPTPSETPCQQQSVTSDSSECFCSYKETEVGETPQKEQEDAGENVLLTLDLDSLKVNDSNHSSSRNGTDGKEGVPPFARDSQQDEEEQRAEVEESTKRYKSDIKKAAQILERGNKEIQPAKVMNKTDDSSSLSDNRSICLTGSMTMTQMLLHTYGIADSEPRKSNPSDVSLTPQQKRGALMLESPAPSVDTVDTPMSTTSKPMVSEEAIHNATFLFSPSYAEGDQDLLKLPAPHKGATPFAITTADARSRLGSHPRPDPSEYGLDSLDYQTSTRRVRFSDPDVAVESAVTREPKQLEEIQVQPIERNFSDLTEMTGYGRESLVSVGSSHHPSVTPIPEESFDEPSPQTEIVQEDYSTEGYPTNWYNNMDNGVTPLRSGKSVNNATHSPFIRFKEAKKKFATTEEAEKNNLPEPVCKPRESGGLVKSRIDAMEEKVHQSNEQKKSRRDTTGHEAIAPRKAALQSRHFSSGSAALSLEDDDSMTYPWETSKEPIYSNEEKLEVVSGSPWVPPVQQTSNGYDGDSSRAGSLSTNGIDDRSERLQHFSVSPDVSDARDSTSQSLRYSGMSGRVRFDLGDSKEARYARDSLSAASDAQRESASIVSATTQNYQSEMDTTVDDFAMLLNAEEEDDDGSSQNEGAYEEEEESFFDGETVSTVRQVDEVDRLISKDHLYSEDSATGDNATVSTIETLSESVATVRQQRETFASTGDGSTLSSVLKAETPVLPFRENSAGVRPNEQVPRPGPGALCLSPMQRTPLQAMKWRTLAAKNAAQENESHGPFGKFSTNSQRKSLSERNPNLLNIM